MTLLSISRVAAVFAATLGCACAAQAQSVYTMTVSQEGNNVVITGSGSINLTGLTFGGLGGSAEGGQIDSAFSSIVTGLPPTSGYWYFLGLQGPSSDPFASNFTYAPDSNTGYYVGFQNHGAGLVYVPDGYESGAALQSSSTYDNLTIAGLNLVDGDYTMSWSGGVIDLDIGGSISSSVPEPASLAVLGLPLAALLLTRRRAAAPL